MNMTSSLFLGEEGNYNFFGFPIKFEKSPEIFDDIDSNDQTDIRQAIATTVHYSTLPTLQTFVYEMTRAAAIKLFTNATISDVHIPIGRYKESKTNVLLSAEGLYPLSPKQKKQIELVADVGSIVLSGCKFFALNTLSNYFSTSSIAAHCIDLLKMGTCTMIFTEFLDVAFGPAGLRPIESVPNIYKESLATVALYNIAKMGLRALVSK